MAFRDRGLLVLGRALRRSDTTNFRAVVASTWHFPRDTHTFVCQEMESLALAGFDIRIFCWEEFGSKAARDAFPSVMARRVMLQPVAELHAADLAHFRRTRPARLERLLAMLERETGRSRVSLLAEPVVRQAMTFARTAELFGARYLHTYFFYDQSLMALIAAWLLAIPRGITCYVDHVLDDYPLKLIRLHLETADLVVATSRRIEGELLALSAGRGAEKILVKPNGIDGARFPLMSRRASRQQGFELISVSRLEPKKGLLTLLDALVILAGRGRQVLLHVVGAEDPLSAASQRFAGDFAQRVRDLGLRDRVCLHGHLDRKEVARLLAQADAFVAPYVETETGDKDGIPTAMLEAMATGLPVITTDAGSIPEVVDDGVEGLLVPQRDAPRLADAVEQLLLDPELAGRLGRMARRRQEAEFDVRVTEPRFHARIREIVAAWRPPGSAEET